MQIFKKFISSRKRGRKGFLERTNIAHYMENKHYGWTKTIAIIFFGNIGNLNHASLHVCIDINQEHKNTVTKLRAET